MNYSLHEMSLANKQMFFRKNIWSISVGDKEIIDEVFEEKVYDLLWANEIKEGDVVFDIWANIWAFSICYADSNRSGKWHLFEPLGSNYELLQKNISLNKLSNCIAYNLWVVWWDKESFVAQINISEFNTWWHSLLNTERVSWKEDCRFVGIDRFIIDNNIQVIDYAKIDCEWAEFTLFYESPLFLQKVKKMAAEIHYFEDSEENPSIDELSLYLSKQWFNVDIIKKINILWEWIFYLIVCTKKYE